MSKTWEYYGHHDPYYGVLSAPEYRADRMDSEARQRFFASGVADVNRHIEIAEQAFGPLTSRVALDYGCGVGRLSRRLAERFERVIAVDVSHAMLEAARENLNGLNVSFERADRMTGEPVDFILSHLVFQHIPPSSGLNILTALAGRLRGTGVINVPIRYTGSLPRRILRTFRRLIKAGVPFGKPIIPMYVYDLEAAVARLEGAGCSVKVDRYAVPLFENATMIFHRD